jgi:putative ABC transport system permease protein
MIVELMARVRSLWRGVVRTRQVDADLKEEFRLHIELRAADLVRVGMTPAEAARKARAEFGNTEHHVEKARNARGLRWFDEMRFSGLDLRLGARMLVKYPVLTIVGGFSMAFAIWVGAGTFEAIRQLVFPTIPLPDADRIVMLQNWDASTNRPEPRATHDFVAWRSSVQSVQDLGAYRTVTRNLMITDGLAEPVLTAEMSAAAFRVLRVPPVLGRTLVESEERADAPLVAVISYDLWQSRFKGDSGVIGRTVRLTGAPSTVVGVMPAGFAFPRTQELWVPLRIDVSGDDRRQGMAIQIFGRLAPGASLEQARAELTYLGRRAAVDFPHTHQHLRPQLFTFAESVRAIQGPGESMMLLTGNIYVIMLLVLVCANVALLMYARATTRETEIIVRSALGASRRRIVMQMFAEALVLGGVAAVVGLTAAGWGVRWGLDLMRGVLTDGSGNFPFWVDGKLSPLTFVYTTLLTLLASAIAGVLPGLKITRNLGNSLKRTAPGAGGMQFGGMWTVLIVLQIAVTMGFPVVTFVVSKDYMGIEADRKRLPFPVDQYLSVRLEMEQSPTEPGADTSAAAFQARYVAAAQKLETRLESEPGVSGVVFAEHLPRQYHPNNQVEVDEGAVAADERGHRVGSSNVDPKYLDVLGVSMLSGRWFNTSEASPDARVAVVNKAFVDRVMGGRNPIGRRLRYVWDPPPQPWFEIIGVAPDVGIKSGWGAAGIYRPLVRASMYPLNAAIHVRGDPKVFAQRLRAIATDVDVTLRLADLMTFKDVETEDAKSSSFWFKMLAIVSATMLVSSLVSIYAVMSFAVSRRTREIGVRVALGGSPWRIVRAVFAHSLRQLGMGLLAGTVLVWALQGGTDNGWPTATELLTLGAYTTLMTIVFLIACVVPTWRALAVQPTEALRDY